MWLSIKCGLCGKLIFIWKNNFDTVNTQEFEVRVLQTRDPRTKTDWSQTELFDPGPTQTSSDQDWDNFKFRTDSDRSVPEPGGQLIPAPDWTQNKLDTEIDRPDFCVNKPQIHSYEYLINRGWLNFKTGYDLVVKYIWIEFPYFVVGWFGFLIFVWRFRLLNFFHVEFNFSSKIN